ncbi:hypothetical protein BDZ97DRAFT_1915511 [Flammula alnicola]|nr:hypothetical protein BDZ97DRAFT_1915511 [Flammula alnicola]
MPSCLAYSFPVSTNQSLGTELTQTLFLSFHLKPDPSLLDQSSFLSALYCAADTAQQCFGICPNADLAGVGVRAAFWMSSILQAILVAVSPEDSTQGAWTAAILTASVTIPAFIQKRQQLLSVYHATLVLNFATFSSVVSLAVAPMCTVWRQGSQDELDSALQNDEHPEIEVAIYGEEGQPIKVDASEPLSNIPRRKVHQHRLILSLALLMQVALQWTWAIILFTDPEYAQKACNPDTIVLLFGKPFATSTINHGLFVVWPMWLLFNVLITLVWGVLLVYNSSPSVHPVLSRHPSRSVDLPSTWQPSFPIDKGRIMVLIGNIMAFLISVLFLVSSEVQVAKNCVLGGENTSWSFGQVAALLVALAPAWSIFAAIQRNKRSDSINADDIEISLPKDRRSASPYTPTDGTRTPVNEAPDDSHAKNSIVEEPIDPQFLGVPRDPCRHRTLRKGDSVQ